MQRPKRTERFSYSGAERVIEYLRALKVDDGVTVEQGDQIAEFIADQGGFPLFRELDERPGQFDGNYSATGWHWKLRQARNDGRNRFFEKLIEPKGD